MLYLPYAAFCYARPALSVLYGFTGFKIERIDPVDSDLPTTREDAA